MDNYPDGMTSSDYDHVEGSNRRCHCGHYHDDHDDHDEDSGECLVKDCYCDGFDEYTKEDAEYDKADAQMDEREL